MRLSARDVGAIVPIDGAAARGHGGRATGVFWSTWNRPNYTAVKKLTNPHHRFRDLYSKTCRAARGLDDVAA